MPFAPIRDLDLYYERGGNPESGRRLLMISGSGGDLRQKPNVFDGPLAEEFELLAYDQRGLGQTSKPEGPYTMADYGADAIALLDHVGWQTCSVYGVSFGGMVAQELAVTVPERIERLVLACTSPGGVGRASYPLDELAARPPEEAAKIYPELLDTRGSDAGPVVAMIMKAMARGREEGAQSAEAEAGYRKQLAARKSHDTFDRLGRLSMPVLIAAGRYDGIARPENQIAMHSAIAGSRLEWFEGGHVFMFQDPRANEAIRRFLVGEDS